MYVQSEHSFDVVGDFDPDNSTLVEFERDHAPSGFLETPLRGHFATVGGAQLVLFRAGDRLKLSVDGEQWVLPGGIDFEWESANGLSLIRLRQGDRIVRLIEYTSGPETGSPIEEDPITAGVESEHWDFGEFVHMVLSDPGRMNRIYLP